MSSLRHTLIPVFIFQKFLYHELSPYVIGHTLLMDFKDVLFSRKGPKYEYK